MFRALPFHLLPTPLHGVQGKKTLDYPLILPILPKDKGTFKGHMVYRQRLLCFSVHKNLLSHLACHQKSFMPFRWLFLYLLSFINVSILLFLRLVTSPLVLASLSRLPYLFCTFLHAAGSRITRPASFFFYFGIVRTPFLSKRSTTQRFNNGARAGYSFSKQGFWLWPSVVARNNIVDDALWSFMHLFPLTWHHYPHALSPNFCRVCVCLSVRVSFFSW